MSERQEVHHTNRVLDHYETRTRQVPHTTTSTESYSCTKDLGNGRFETTTCHRTVSHTTYPTETYQEPIYRDDPVYATKYTYDIERWVDDHVERAAGEDHTPVWPEVVEDATHRKGATTEHYWVIFSDGKRTYRMEVPAATWAALTPGERVVLDVDRQGNLEDFRAGAG